VHSPSSAFRTFPEAQCTLIEVKVVEIIHRRIEQKIGIYPIINIHIERERIYLYLSSENVLQRMRQNARMKFQQDNCTSIAKSNEKCNDSVSRDELKVMKLVQHFFKIFSLT
jgi:hypothetical protein